VLAGIGFGSWRWCRSRSSVGGLRSGRAGAGRNRRLRFGPTRCRCSSRTRRPRRTCSASRCSPADGQRGSVRYVDLAQHRAVLVQERGHLRGVGGEFFIKTADVGNELLRTPHESGPGRCGDEMRRALVALTAVREVGAPPAINSRSNACNWLRARVLLCDRFMATLWTGDMSGELHGAAWASPKGSRRLRRHFLGVGHPIGDTQVHRAQRRVRRAQEEPGERPKDGVAPVRS
jgi:hypothetical protein